MANSTGEGKGLSAEQVREQFLAWWAQQKYRFTYTTSIMGACEAAWNGALLAAQPADSALRLKLEPVIAEWFALAEEALEEASADPEFEQGNSAKAYTFKRCANRLSTLLTEESSQVGTKEGE